MIISFVAIILGLNLLFILLFAPVGIPMLLIWPALCFVGGFKKGMAKNRRQ